MSQDTTATRDRAPRRRRWPILAGALLLAFAALAFALPYGLYWHALKDLRGPSPQAQQRYPDALRQLYWNLHGGQGPIRVRRLSPPGYARELFADPGDGRAASVPADQQLLYLVAGLQQTRLPPRTGMLRWHLGQAALAIRLSREYDAGRLIDYALEHGRFADQGPVGIDAAARLYFDLPVESLSAQEQLALLMLAHGPAYFDPACHPNRFARRYARALEKTGLASAQAIPARMRAGTCARRGGDGAS
ncbi:transglycosylase domain-containing protein [Lysobacter enzymogenes]|nr:transglycosylase domain-containing protein [Lysobacter enzymogenes]